MERTNHVPLIHDLLEAVNAHDAVRVAHFHAADYEGLDVSRASLKQGRLTSSLQNDQLSSN